MNYLISILISGLVTLGVSIFNPPQIWDEVVNFGATNFPASLDTLTNPAATDSVATVSHSSQHSNANDAIEAIEAKLGTGASTAVANTWLVGNGSGSSIWSSYATGTSLSLSGLGTFGSFVSQASSTIVGGLTITGNSTTTNATSTIGAFTSFATSTSWYGGGLSTCIGGNVLTWTGGLFGCAADLAGVGGVGIATSTYTNNTANKEVSTSTTVGASKDILIWATGSPECNAASQQYSLWIKPPTTASTSLDNVWLPTASCANGDNHAVSLQGMYRTTETGSHKIFLQAEAYIGLWTVGANQGDASTSIMYIIN